MSNINSTDYLLHDIIRSVRQTFTALSIILSIPAITVVALCVNRSSRSYSTNIILTVIIGVMSNIILQFAWDPILPMPTACVLRQNPLIPLPGSAGLYYGIWLAVTSQNMPTYMACFIERHQAVQLPGSKWIVSYKFQLVFEISLVAFAISIGCLLAVTIAPQVRTDAYLQALEIDWPELSNHHPSCLDITMFAIYAFSLVFGVLGGIAIIVGLTYHTFAQLRISLTMSENKRQFNKLMTRVLIIQSIVPVVLIGIPLATALGIVLPFGFLVRVLSGPLPLSICFLFVSTHSSVHSIIMLTMTPIYRRKAVELLKKLTGIRITKIIQKKEHTVSAMQ